MVLNFIDLDGTMKGYSIDIIKHLKGYITVPLSVMGVVV
ncbi:hypothetical protein HOB87_03735 [Candidatus Woesearchaeota archaeon]|nr:hypothetical protein [Candidatus Woesearchaeota archaeon]